MRFLVATLVAVLGCACAAGARADRAYAPGTAITAVDTAGHNLAAGIRWTRHGCEGAILWQPPYFARYTFRVPGPCPQTSTGRGVTAVAVAGFRLLFLSYVGGNTREWRLWTVTPTAPRPRLLRTATADADSPAPIVLGNGGRDGAPYALGSEVFSIAPNGSRRLTWTAPAAVTMLAENSSMVAVVLGSGDVFSLEEGSGNELAHASFPAGDVLAARPIAGGLVVQTKEGISLRRGTVVRDLPTPAGARMIGYVDGWLGYTIGGEIRAYSWQRKQDVLIRDVGRTVLADLDANGLVWAAGGTVCWSTRSYVFSRTHPIAAGCGR